MDLKTRGVRVVVSVPEQATATSLIRPYTAGVRRADVERAVAAIAAFGERTLVLGSGRGATRLLPKLPSVCFVESGDFTGAAIRQAVEHGLTQVVLAGKIGRMADVLTARTGRTAALLTDITQAVTDEPAQVTGVRHAYHLWESTGRLGPCGRELCRRTAELLEGFGDGRIAAQVVLLDPTAQKMIAMYGRLAR